MLRSIPVVAATVLLVARAHADKFCDQMKALEKAGEETPRFGSLRGETLTDTFGGGRYTTGTLEPQGMGNCLIQPSRTRDVQMRYECTSSYGATVEVSKASFGKLGKGVEGCFGVKGATKVEPDYTVITYKLGARLIEVALAGAYVSLTYYPEPG